MKEIIKNYWLDFKNGTKTMFKEFFNKTTNKKQRANMWTFARFITPILTLICSIIAIITASMPMFVVTGMIAGLGGLTDKFDGASARKHNSYSEYGKLLDQVTDKCFAGIIGINLLFINFNYIVILLGELSIATVNLSYKLKYKDLNINSTMFGKVKQTPLFISLALGFFSTINPTLLLISNISIILTILFQSATALSYVVENNKSVKKLENIKNKTIIELNESNEKDKSKNLKNNELKNKKTISKKEQCEKLRKLRNELMDEKEDYIIIEKNNYQKIKK